MSLIDDTARYRSGEQRTKMDDSDDVIDALRDGLISVSDRKEKKPEKKEAPVEDTPRKKTEPTTTAGTIKIPGIIAKVLASDHAKDLVGFAEYITREAKKDITFHTDAGDIVCKVSSPNIEIERLNKPDELVMFKVHSGGFFFSPKPGVPLKVSFKNQAGEFWLTSLSRPYPLFPGVDLLVFLTHDPIMEKQAVIRAGETPSVVSGKKSDHIDEDTDEAVNGSEKSASVSMPEAADFDKPRED